MNNIADDLLTAYNSGFVDGYEAGKRVNITQGEWIQISRTTYECSNCKVWWSWDGTQEESGMFFCPNCGADMREKEKDERSRKNKTITR